MVGIACTTSIPVFAQESALAEAKAKAQASPANADLAIGYGRALRRAGHETEAMTELRRAQAMATGPAAVNAGWEIARTYIAKRDFFGAKNACGQVQKLHERGAVAAGHVCMAEAHLLWRRGTEALGEIAEAEKVADAPADVRYFQKVAEGRSRELDSKEDLAEARYKDAINLAPNRDEAYVLLGSMLSRTGKDGLSALQKAAELDPHDPVAQLELGRALESTPKRHGEAIAAYERAVAERPGYVDALRSLTEAYIAENRLADSKKTAATLLKIAPNDVFAHVANGRVALADGKTDDAIKEGETALKLMPNEALAKLLVADALAKKGEIDLAVEAYQKASGLDPLNPTPLVNAAHACIAANRLTTAKAFGQRAVLDFPDNSQAWVADGDALAADGNSKAAKTAYEKAKTTRGADVATIDGKLSKLR
jgi:tetratricopeptide (TPR) repeat protein